MTGLLLHWTHLYASMSKPVVQLMLQPYKPSLKFDCATDKQEVPVAKMRISFDRPGMNEKKDLIIQPRQHVTGKAPRRLWPVANDFDGKPGYTPQLVHHADVTTNFLANRATSRIRVHCSGKYVLWRRIVRRRTSCKFSSGNLFTVLHGSFYMFATSLLSKEVLSTIASGCEVAAESHAAGLELIGGRIISIVGF